LLAWAELHGRHDLPGQQEPTPYRVWVSEVMLQQTQVATVLPYYIRFVARFPDISALAAAPLDDVLSLWTGLGYYARARNLHRAARIVRDEHAGCLPLDIATLQRLPGIGRSTAGAILALSIGQRQPILDGNARRVLARYFAVEGDPTDRETLQRLWSLAEGCTPDAAVAQYTQAIMDLGAGVCVRSRPRCDACPLREACAALRTGRQHDLPSPRRRAVRPQRSAYALVLIDSRGCILLERRPTPGLWGGLWSFPAFDSEAQVLDALANVCTCQPQRLPAQHHAFTHYDLTLHPLAVTLHDASSPQPVERQRWFTPADLKTVGLTKAVTRFLANVASEPALAGPRSS
jgi:A/G-specific adenine glycosylase